MELDFCQGWTFAKEGQLPILVNLPHDAMLTEARTVSCHNGDRTGYFPGGKYIYEKDFTLTREEVQNYAALRFGGVYRHAVVTLNGTPLHSQFYGYTEFTVSLTSAAVEGYNHLTVTVDNSLEPNSRWYTGSGIYRPVTLILRPKDHVGAVRISTVSISPAVIEVTCGDDAASVEILDGRQVIASGRPGKLTIPDAKLWSAEKPYLYVCRVKKGSDQLELPFGIRSLSFSAENGFLVNGERVLLRGGCVHHDNGVLGACAFPDAEERRIRILKRCGYNAIRSAHNPCSTELLDACDRLGMYVLDEAYDGWYTPKTHHDSSRTFRSEYLETLDSMVNKDYNHPSVIMYSIGNEVTEVGQTEGVALAREMTEHLHTLDISRPVTCGINVMLTVWAKMGIELYKDSGNYQPEPLPADAIPKLPKGGSDVFNALAMRLGKFMGRQVKTKQADRALSMISNELDIMGLNYGHYRYDKELRDHPERMILGTETYIDSLPYNWKRVKEHPAVLGDFCWVAMDYLGEAGIGYWAYPSEQGLPLLAGSGAVDILGTPDAENGFQQVVWGLRKEPYLAVRPVGRQEKPREKTWRFTNAIPCWNWQGHEGAPVTVEVYADAAEVELRCEGKKIGCRRLKEYRAMFHTTYVPGKLEAIAYDVSGQETGRSFLVSGNRPRLSLKAEKTELRANGQDLCYVMIELADEHGILCPMDDVQIQVEVQGGATLQGLGSARCVTQESYLANTHLTYQGRCLAVLRAGTEAGTAQMEVSAVGFGMATVAISIV